ncbi:MAG: Bax inhibitor-1/YccA family protein [Thermodesulfobacteriota bacterium]|nr:Bax inhibitor-1/YccA family protein [Thermodesulfobacteriota bacterium]
MAEPVSLRTTQSQSQVAVNSFIRSTYNWMAIGLALTGFIAFYVAGVIENMMQTNPAALRSIQPLFFVLIIAELGLVFFLSARIQKIQATTATALFVIYSMLNGVTLSFIFIAYTQTSIAATFFVCAATFGACSVYGMVTKRDLTGVGQFMFMGLIGIIIASVVNLFMQSSALAMIVSYIGVFVFVGLTAYDTQQLKQMALSQPDDLDAGVFRKGAIMGALRLYLDFINMFIFLLHIMGVARE